MGQLASTSFSRTAYIAASVRERSRSFSRMLRTWFLTVFSAITSWAAISLFDMPRATRRSTSTSRSVSFGSPPLASSSSTRRESTVNSRRRFADQRRRNQSLAAVRRPHRVRDLLDRHLLQQVAGRARAHRREEVLLVVGAGEHHDLARRAGRRGSARPPRRRCGRACAHPSARHRARARAPVRSRRSRPPPRPRPRCRVRPRAPAGARGGRARGRPR